MKNRAKPVPDGFHTVTPSLVVNNAAKAIDFYKKALSAEEKMRMTRPDGKIMHAEIKIGDSIIFLSDECPEGMGLSPQSLGGFSSSLNIYLDDVDTAFKRAVDAGGKSVMPVTDMFWGDRYGAFTDPFGHQWGIATHTEDLSPQETEERGRAFFAQMAQRKTA